ncbi:calcium-dependent phosphotriesterase [Schizophyllum commune]
MQFSYYSHHLQYVNPRAYNVISKDGTNNSFRASPFDPWNPTNTSGVFFQVFDNDFYNVIGENPWIHEISSDPTFAFAHEAPVWVPDTDEVFIASNAGGPLGRSGPDANNQIERISLKEVDEAMGGTPTDVNVSHPKVDLPDFVQMANGGTGPYKGNIIFMNEGRGNLPSNMVLVNPYPPYNASILLDNFYGREFNALNDAKVHSSGVIFFTDPAYAYLQHFKAEPGLPNQVYAFDPSTGHVRVVADQLNKPNGLAFSNDFKTLYIVDSGLLGADWGNNATLPATIYAYDVPDDLFLVNRRVFAYSDEGSPDGVNVDVNGYVYGGCGDGIHVWNPKGILVGKFFTGSNTANFAFAGPGRLVILAETKVYLASIAAEGVSVIHE